jgi:hypothetical protein
MQEHELFLKGLELYGRKWTKIQALIPNKTVTQVRTHAYGYFAKLLRRVPNERDLLEVAHIMSGMRNRDGEGDDEDDEEEEDDSRANLKALSANGNGKAAAVPSNAAPSRAAAAPAVGAPARETNGQAKAKSDDDEDSGDEDVIHASGSDWHGKRAQKERHDSPSTKANPLHLLAKYADAGKPDRATSSEHDQPDDEDDEEELESDEERRAIEAIRSIARRGGEQSATAARNAVQHQESDQHDA